MRTRNKLREAIDLLHTRGPATSESYTQLVLECVRNNDVAQAKRLHSHMDLHLYRPANTFLFNRLLHLYAKSGSLSDAQNLFDKMPQRDVISYNAMLSAYSKLGSVYDLWVFWDLMPRRDSVSYNTVMAGLSAKGCWGRALEVFVRMQKDGFEASDYTFVSVLNVCSRALVLKVGKQIHSRVIVSDLGGNVYVWNALMDMYAKCGEIHHARWLFNQTVGKNLVSWNAMISGYLKNGLPDECISLFHEMKLSGLKPDDVTIANILGALFQTGRFDEANKVFSEFKVKDVVCWTTMIVGYSQYGKEEDALDLFSRMLQENAKPDKFTISAVVSSSARLTSLYHGQVVHAKAVHIGVGDDLLVSSALVDMYFKCGETIDACNVFSNMPIRSVVSWNSMIVGLAQNGKDLEAIALFEEMLKENFKPDIITFVGVLSACTHAGLVKEGEDYFNSISELHKMTPSLDHYVCMINLFGRFSHKNKAIDLVNTMPHEPNNVIWSTLLSICSMNNDIEHGEIAARKLFELDPSNAGPFIMLSNMYAASGRWNDVASVRSLMKNKNVKKNAAYSWIDIDGEFHKFVAEDRTHPESEKIYEELNELIKELQSDGFTPHTKLVLHDVKEDEKMKSICYHSEKLALAFGLLRKPNRVTPVRILKNIRVCPDCHEFMKFVSKVKGRKIILRDSNRFHHFVGGQCSCNDLW